MDEKRLQVTEDQVLAALAEVRDPDHGENIVALGWLHVHGVDSRHARTLRLHQSMIATRYRKPFASGMYVMSAHHAWLGRSMPTPRSRYG